MYYGTIKKYDIANGPGVRVSLFVSGCRHHCKGCFNAETWDFRYGQLYTEETEKEILAALEPGYIQGFTLLGGEPFEPENQRTLLPLLREVRQKYPGKTVWCFTGFRLDDELLCQGSHPRCEATDDMLACIDVLVDGRFREELKDISLQFRGSRNQRIIDMNQTRRTGVITLWDKLRK